MICQKCGMKNAVVHYTNIVNNNKIEVHLCEACARERENNILLGINDLMSGFLGIKTQDDKNTLKCDYCGLTQNDVSKRGKAGCEHCYAVFSEYLVPIIRRVHGTDTHVGKKPLNNAGNSVEGGGKNKETSGKVKVEELEAEMKQAVANEEYERAAKIRDKIKKLRQSS